MMLSIPFTFIVLFLTAIYGIQIDFKSEFKVQKYKTPQPSRLQASIIYDDILLLIGGVIDNGPNTARNVLGLDLQMLNRRREWEVMDDIPQDKIEQPWYHSSNNAFYIGKEIYLACDDDSALLDRRDILRYDPESGDFIPVEGSIMPFKVEDCCATAIGREIFIIAGADVNGADSSRVQIFNIDTKIWRDGPALDAAFQEPGCVNVNDQEIYVFGGIEGPDVVNTVRKYSASQQSWTKLTNTISTAARNIGVSWVPYTPYIILSGGRTSGDGDNPDTEFLTQVEVWNIDKGNIDQELSSRIPQLNIGRGGHASIIQTIHRQRHSPRHNLFIIGGETSLTSVTDTTEILRFRTSTPKARKKSHRHH